MADKIDRRPGGGGGTAQHTLYKDTNGSTFFPETTASYLYGWDTTALDWAKLLVDHVSGILLTKAPRASTPAQSSVAGSASSASLLAANTARLGATIYNDSTATLYVKLGATASTSSFTVRLDPGGYYEVPFNYTGAIDGIWSSAAGNARITEFSA